MSEIGESIRSVVMRKPASITWNLKTSMQRMPSQREGEEERVVAELELLGIRYLSRNTRERAGHVRPAEVLLADLVKQPSARVRAAVIAVLLAYPEYAKAVPAALVRLQPAAARTLRMFYTAAVLLQQVYHERLPASEPGARLPDSFGADLGLPADVSPRERLKALGRLHRQQTMTAVNWAGTYENVVRRLLRAWELESRWNQLQQPTYGHSSSD